jgi:hypothetical protein
MKLFVINLLLMIIVPESKRCYQYCASKADGNPAPHEEMPFYLFFLFGL